MFTSSLVLVVLLLRAVDAWTQGSVRMWRVSPARDGALRMATSGAKPSNNNANTNANAKSSGKKAQRGSSVGGNYPQQQDRDQQRTFLHAVHRAAQDGDVAAFHTKLKSFAYHNR